MAYPYIVQGKNIVVVIDNKPFQIGPAHIAYEKIKQAIKDEDWDTVRDSVEPKEVIIQYAEGNVRIEGDKIYWFDEELHPALAARMIEMYKDGFSVTPLVNFIDNLMDNPSARAVNELYGFLEKCNLPITEDGYFLAYKKVREDYLDVYSGTISNKVGEVVTMPRRKVNDKANETCSYGLHFCSIDYLANFGGNRVVILKINPADVVSIPTDYNNAKGRCCAYEVVGEVEDMYEPERAFTKAVDTRYTTQHSGLGLRQIEVGWNGSKRWIRANGTYASRAEIDSHLRGVKNVSTDVTGQAVNIWQNATGQWIRPNGTFASKKEIDIKLGRR